MTTMRPSSPVANTPDERQPQQEIQTEMSAEATAAATTSADAAGGDNSYCAGNNDMTGGVSSSSSSAIPNLLSLGKFSPHSPKKAASMNHSYDHNIVTMMVSSPTIPAAPPSTPYTPNNNNTINPLNHRILPSSPPLMPQPNFESSNSTSSASSRFAPFPPPFNIRPISPGVGGIPPLPAAAAIGGVATSPPSPSLHNHHYDALLRQALHATAESERSRIESLTRHESENYTTVEQYQRALAHERRHYSAALALEVTKLSFHTRYTSCDVHAAAEISEEARINNMIKNMTTLKKDMNEDRCRVVMELERDEERIINRLMMRLDEVTREKRLLECQINGLDNVRKQQGNSGGGKVGVGGGSGGGDGGVQIIGGGRGLMGDGNNERTLNVHFDRMIQMADDSDGTDVLHDTAPLLERVVAAGMVNDDNDAQPTWERHHIPRGTAAYDDAEERIIGSELIICKDDTVNEGSEDEEEEEEEDGNGADDVLEGQCHNDSDMEEELEKLLKMKEGHRKNDSA